MGPVPQGFSRSDLDGQSLAVSRVFEKEVGYRKIFRLRGLSVSFFIFGDLRDLGQEALVYADSVNGP